MEPIFLLQMFLDGEPGKIQKYYFVDALIAHKAADLISKEIFELHPEFEKRLDIRVKMLTLGCLKE